MKVVLAVVHETGKSIQKQVQYFLTGCQTEIVWDYGDKTSLWRFWFVEF